MAGVRRFALNLLIVISLLAGCVAQAAGVVAWYGAFRDVLVPFVLGLAFYFVLLSRRLKPGTAGALSLLLALVAEYFGVVAAFNTYGT